MKNFTKISLLLCVLFGVFSCKKEVSQIQDVNKQSNKNPCNCNVEEAYPNIKGEIINFKLGDDIIKVEKKAGHYILEGDIILSDEQIKLLTNLQNSKVPKTKSTFIWDFTKVWTNNIVYYSIDPSLPDQNRVINAIAHWQNNTPLTFIQRTDQADYILFSPGAGCSSNVGRTGGRQVITLSSGCNTGATIHEIGHAVGLFHEQSRSDRDNFITIHTNNIEPGREHNFQTYQQRNLSGFETGTFDFNSIMLYHSWAFSANGQPTITRNDGSTFSSQRDVLSIGDLEGINYLYGAKYYIKYRLTTVEQSYTGDEWYSEEYRKDRLSIKFFQDAGCTIPISLPTNLKVKVRQDATDYYSDSNPSYTYYYVDYNLTSGNHEYLITDFESNAVYEYGITMQGSYYQSGAPEPYIKYENAGTY